MAHRGRFTITTVSNPDVPVDISFKRESQLSPKGPQHVDEKSPKPGPGNHHQELNKPDTSPKSAQQPVAPQPSVRNGVKPVQQAVDMDHSPQQRDTPVFHPEQLHSHKRKESKSVNSPYRTELSSNAEETRLVPMQLVTMLQESLCGKFTEMMQMHKEVMGEMATRDQRRDEQMSLLISQNIELVRTVTRLRCEQAMLREAPLDKSTSHRPQK